PFEPEGATRPSLMRPGGGTRRGRRRAGRAAAATASIPPPPQPPPAAAAVPQAMTPADRASLACLQHDWSTGIDRDRGGEGAPRGHATRRGGTHDTPDPHNHAERACRCGAIWARLDSNQGPRDYESPALTN